MTRRVIPSQKLRELSCPDPLVQGFINGELRQHVAEVYQQFTKTSAWEIQVINGEITISSDEDTDVIRLNATKVRSGVYTDPTYYTGNPGFAHAGTGNASFGSFARYESGTAFGASLALMKSRSDTPDALTIVQADDDCGDISFFGNDGTSWICCARIFGQIDGTPGTNDMPGRLTFHTVADGGTTQVERMRIAQNGYITTGNSTGLTIGGTGETLATFVDDGAVTLYHDNSARLATAAGGVNVTGGLVSTGTIDAVTFTADGATGGGYGWDNDADTFIYRNAADSVILQVGGAAVLAVTSLVQLGATGATPTHVLNTNTATGASAGADTLPANPVGFIVITINGTNRKIPYYAT